VDVGLIFPLSCPIVKYGLLGLHDLTPS